MKLRHPLRVGRTGRGRMVLAGAAVLAAVGLAAGQFLTTSAAHAAGHRSVCNQGIPVGEICHYVDVVSDGPDYDIDGYLLSPSGGKDYTWHEANPKFTTWFWHYSQFGAQQDTMNVIINLRGGSNIGLTDQFPMTEDRCYLITSQSKIITRSCPSS